MRSLTSMQPPHHQGTGTAPGQFRVTTFRHFNITGGAGIPSFASGQEAFSARNGTVSLRPWQYNRRGRPTNGRLAYNCQRNYANNECSLTNGSHFLFALHAPAATTLGRKPTTDSRAAGLKLSTSPPYVFDNINSYK